MKQPKTFADPGNRNVSLIFDPFDGNGVLDEANDSNDEKVQTSVPDVKEMSPKEATENSDSKRFVPAVVGEGKKGH